MARHILNESTKLYWNVDQRKWVTKDQATDFVTSGAAYLSANLLHQEDLTMQLKIVTTDDTLPTGDFVPWSKARTPLSPELLSEATKDVSPVRTLSIGEIAALASVANDNYSGVYAADIHTLRVLQLIAPVSPDTFQRGYRTYELTPKGHGLMVLLTGIQIP